MLELAPIAIPADTAVLRTVVEADDEVGDVVHRSGTIERIQRDEVVDACGLRLAQQFAHAAAAFLVPAELQVVETADPRLIDHRLAEEARGRPVGARGRSHRTNAALTSAP